jgi:hypothetical protein
MTLGAFVIWDRGAVLIVTLRCLYGQHAAPRAERTLRARSVAELPPRPPEVDMTHMLMLSEPSERSLMDPEKVNLMRRSEARGRRFFSHFSSPPTLRVGGVDRGGGKFMYLLPRPYIPLR